ncbi:MAG: SusC/RagA family TonB-linked outer membrane protein [Chitinophagaceae bacterium]
MKKYLLLVWVVLGVFILPNGLKAQSLSVTGKVMNRNGSPIPGAYIQILSSNLGTTADQEGKFSLRVPQKAILLIHSIGFKSRTIPIDSSTHLQIKLEDDVAKLDELVVTGLTTSVKRRNLANDVTTISGKELSGIAPAATLDAALEGKIPGAYINANTGAPGGGISIKLRGVTSIYGNTQPLFVVDGVMLDNTSTSAGLNAITAAQAGGSPTSNQDNPSSRIADLRPEDIASIEILKGASAAAIYGSEAAAGVVIITTKRGKPGKTKITVSQDFGVITARKLLGVRQFNADRAASLSSDSATSVALRQEFLDAQAAGHLYDYEKEIYGNTGLARNTGITMSGGGKNTTFYFSAGQEDEGGIVKNTGYRNSSMRLNLDHWINKNIKIGISTNYINSSADRGLSGNDNSGVSLGIALSSTPDFAQLHPDKFGNYPNNPFAASNPLQTIALMRNNEAVNRFLTGLNLSAVLQNGNRSNIRLIAQGGLDFYNLVTTALFPSILQFQAVNKGTSIQGFTRNINTNFILSLVNVYTPSAHLSFTTSAGLTQEMGNYNNLLNVATQVIAGQSNVDQAGSLTATQFRNKFQNNGIFLQEEASLFKGLTLTGGVRFDQSSNDGNAAKYYTYPKAGVSWDLTRMGILKQGFFDQFKLRAAYGEANNVPAYGSKFTSLVISNIAGYPGSLVGTQKGDPQINPERQSEFETGMDFSLLRGRLGFDLTYYNKNIYDFLMLGSLPSSSGFSTKWVNAGNLRNRGVELGLNARPVDSKTITWNTSVNFWLNRSLVTKYTLSPIPLGSFGYVLGSFQLQQGKSATQIVGLNGSGVGVLGDAEPKFQMTTYNEITIKRRLTIMFLLHWKNGGDNINLTNLENDFGGTSADYDQVTNKLGLPNGIYRIMQIGTSARMFVQNASYLRLREIGVYYLFDKLPVNFIQAVRIGISLNNYLTISKYQSYDPEVSNFGTGFSTGVDVDPYPASKTAEFHLSVDF